jgi:predicted RNA binding protein YcfA (HicA-like mRNA interferase family)
MSGKLPRITAVKIIKVLEKRGFILVRQSGSHRIFRNPEGNRVTVPYHSKKDLHPKVVKSILLDADMTVEELINSL